MVVTELLNRPGIGEPASWEGRVCTRWFQGGRSLIFMLIDDSQLSRVANIGFIFVNRHKGNRLCRYNEHIISITAQIEKLLSGFGITVDIEDESSGTWMPIPPDSSHSLAQSG